MNKLVTEIIFYLDYLNNTCGLNTSIHFRKEKLSCIPERELAVLLTYNRHKNPYCIKLTSKEGNKKRCLLSQRMVLEKCSDCGSFCGVCYAGVREYIYPVFEDGSVYCGKEKYRLGCNVWDIYNCVDTGWGNLEEVYYLGNFSEEDLGEINCFLASVDLRSEIVVYDEPETVPCLVENDEITNIIWKSRGFRIIYENEDGDLEVFDVEGRGVENGREEISYQTTDENALALKHFVEESSFYTTWLELIFEEAE